MKKDVMNVIDKTFLDTFSHGINVKNATTADWWHKIATINIMTRSIVLFFNSVKDNSTKEYAIN